MPGKTSEFAFEIFRDGEEIPVTYTPLVLEDFRRTKLDRVEAMLDDLSREQFDDDEFPEGADPRLGVIGPMIAHALGEDDQQVIAQCVLWLAIRHPEIWGLEIQPGNLTYLSSAGRGNGVLH